MTPLAPPARLEHTFLSAGVACAAWHYRPVDEASAPAVVLAHGFGATREGGLARYAERFAGHGMHAFVFDYRHFGASDGEPRQLLDIDRQLADWQSAVRAVRAIKGVDPARVALWGTSFSGGHVVRTAARDRQVAAVVAQVPHTSGPVSAMAGELRTQARVTVRALRDVAHAASGRAPVTMPIVGPPGSVAAMTSPDALPGYSALFGDAGFVNAVAARVALRIPRYSPGRDARNVDCPLLVQVSAEDVVTPPGPARRMAARAPRGELREYPYGHFDVYAGEPFERLVGDQLDFLTRTLRLTRSR